MPRYEITDGAHEQSGEVRRSGEVELSEDRAKQINEHTATDLSRVRDLEGGSDENDAEADADATPPEPQEEDQPASAESFADVLPNVGPGRAGQLLEAGYPSFEAIASTDALRLSDDISGIDTEDAEAMIRAAEDQAGE